ncbi:hypothetical protein [Helicobacter sp. 23-1045]
MSLGVHLRRFHAKLRSMNPQVLFRLFRVKTAQSNTANTSIVITHFVRIKLQKSRHCEANIAEAI